MRAFLWVCVCQLPSLSSCSSILVVPFQESRENHFYGCSSMWGLWFNFIVFFRCTRTKKIILTINLSFLLLARIHSWWVHLVPTAIYKKNLPRVSFYENDFSERDWDVTKSYKNLNVHLVATAAATVSSSWAARQQSPKCICGKYHYHHGVFCCLEKWKPHTRCCCAVASALICAHSIYKSHKLSGWEFQNVMCVETC